MLKDISIQVEDRESVSIIGPSGSGKSTLLRCAAMLETIGIEALCSMKEERQWLEPGGRPRSVCGRKEEMKEIQADVRPGVPEFQPVSPLFGC